MSSITISHLSFSHEGSYQEVFSNVSLQIDCSWKLGFCGRNGRGKTTFLKLLMGEYPYQGTISTTETFEYFPYTVPNDSNLTFEIIEEMLPEIPLWEVKKELATLNVLEDVLYRPFHMLSNGEQTKILLAGLFLQKNHFLLIDEPTNHLDNHSRVVLANYLKKKTGFILVSHDRTFLDQCVDHILSINKTDIEITQGNFSVWWEQKKRKELFEVTQNKRLATEIECLKSAARKTENWSHQTERSKYAKGNGGEIPPDRGFVSHKAAKMMKRSKATLERQTHLIEEKSNLLKNVEQNEALKLNPLNFHATHYLTLDRVSIFHEQTILCNEVSFTLNQGDRIALMGANGTGKTSLLSLIRNTPYSFTGSFHKASGLKISYVPQDATFLSGFLDAYAKKYTLDQTLFFTVLRKFDFSRAQLSHPIDTFSDGQKKKVLLARSLCEQAHLYIWDEPLNYIDVYSRMQIEALILEKQPTLLFVEHDEHFCSTMATKQIHLKREPL